jgi:hypothetical protein
MGQQRPAHASHFVGECHRYGLHADKARRQRFEECQHLAAPELLPNNDLLGRVIP